MKETHDSREIIRASRFCKELEQALIDSICMRIFSGFPSAKSAMKSSNMDQYTSKRLSKFLSDRYNKQIKYIKKSIKSKIK